MKILPSEKLTLKNILCSDRFTDSNTDQEFVLTEEFQVCLRLFADHPELNYPEFTQEFDSKITPRSSVTLFQFITPLLPIKRASVAFIMQLLAQRCDPEVVVIMMSASQLLTQEYGGAEGISTKLYVETMGDYLHQIRRTGSLTLATYSLTRLHTDVQQANNTGIYFRFSNAEDREWITRRYALTQYMEDPNRFLQSLENEGLLFNENTPYTIDHFVPYMEKPVILKQLVAEQAIINVKSEEISREQFITLMTILELIVEADQEEGMIFKELEILEIRNPPLQVQTCKSQGYFIIREEGVKQIISISKKGNNLYQEYQTKIDNLPPSLNSDKDKILNIKVNLQERASKAEYLDSSEFQQLVQDIQEFTGSALHKFFTTQKKTDWGLFKDYLTLQEIDDNVDILLIHRMDLLERIYQMNSLTSL